MSQDGFWVTPPPLLVSPTKERLFYGFSSGDPPPDTHLRVIADVAIHVLLLLVLVIENALKMHFSASSQ